MRAALMEYTTASQTAQRQTVLKFQTGAVDTAVRTAGRAGAVKHPYAHHTVSSHHVKVVGVLGGALLSLTGLQCIPLLKPCEISREISPISRGNDVTFTPRGS